MKVLYKKYKLLRKNFRSYLDIQPNEAKYLMSGYCTELVDEITIVYRKYTEKDDKKFNDSPHLYKAKIYGVRAKDNSSGRYCFIYIYFRYYLIKCNSLDAAYELIPIIKEQNILNDKIIALEHKSYELYRKQKKIASESNKKTAA